MIFTSCDYKYQFHNYTFCSTLAGNPVSGQHFTKIELILMGINYAVKIVSLTQLFD